MKHVAAYALLVLSGKPHPSKFSFGDRILVLIAIFSFVSR